MKKPLLWTMLCLIQSLTIQAQTSADTLRYSTPSVQVLADRPRSAAGDNDYRNRDLQLIPRTSTQDLLLVVPGLVIAQHAGGGKAEQIFLRGFDCDHGTDISISVDGAPVNMVSHGHGQGYADLHFVIPETIESISVLKGPYFASYGDQATAGVITMHTADTLKNNIAKAEFGMFESYRALVLAQTSLASTKVYGGAEVYSSRGFFDAPQDFKRANVMVKSFSTISDVVSLQSSLMLFSSVWDASGQIPQRAVDAGLITRYGSIDPREGGNTNRETAQLSLRAKGESPWSIDASYSRYQFQLFSNFTFYAEDPLRGDMIEQTDRRSILSLNAKRDYFYELVGIPSQTRVGISSRYDAIDVGLYHDSERVRISTTTLSRIKQLDAALFAEHSLYFSNLCVMFGARLDQFSFGVQDLAPSASTSSVHLTKAVVSPKLNVSYTFDDGFSVFLNSGFGYHSNDARSVASQGIDNALPRAFGAEVGGRLRHDMYSLSAAAWMLDLQSELVWVGDEGTTEQSGRTRRKGIDLDAQLSPLSWLTFGADLTLSQGRYRDEPEGQNLIALAPSATLSAYTTVVTPYLNAALRLRHISDRPANEDNSHTAEGYTVCDISATIPVISNLELNVEVRNIFNVTWREAQFDTASRLQNEPGVISEIHYTAGTPLNAKVGLAMKF